MTSLFPVSAIGGTDTGKMALSDGLTSGKVPVEMSDRPAATLECPRDVVDAVIAATERQRRQDKAARQSFGRRLQWIVPRHASGGGSTGFPALTASKVPNTRMAPAQDALKASGLEALCLELHSRKATKAAVISSLERALNVGGAVALDADTTTSLRSARDRLNGWSEAMRREIGRSGRTPHHAIGQVLKLRGDNVRPLGEKLEAPGGWGAEELRLAEHSVDRAASAVQKLGIAPIAHPWRGATGDLLAPFDADRLREALDAAHSHITTISAFLGQLHEVLGPAVGECFEDIPRLVVGLRHLAQMPNEGPRGTFPSGVAIER